MQGLYVHKEQQKAKHRPLWHSYAEPHCAGSGTIDTNTVRAVCQVGPQPCTGVLLL